MQIHKKGMALGKRAWRWRKGAWRGAIAKVARGNTTIVQFLVKYEFCCLKCYLAWYFMLFLNDSKCISLINYVNLVILSILNILKISQIQGFPNRKGPRVPSQNCQKYPWC